MSEITTNEIVPAVKATQVHKAFGNLHVLKGIDMTVMPGTVTVILGPSGSGKSTFLRLINQLETLTGGEISFPKPLFQPDYPLREVPRCLNRPSS